MRQEISAGGVVTRGGKLLLIRVRNLQDEVLWTFPKGHLEEGETPREAAVREVSEETGYRCSVLISLTTVRYHFMRDGKPVKKRVRWYWMRPESRAGTYDGEEILDVRWMTPGQARRRLRYRGDFRLLERVAARMARKV